MINTPTIIITSLGRTGTRFFAQLFADLLPNGLALHEPDVIHYANYFAAEGGNLVSQYWSQLKIAGFRHMFVDKLIKKSWRVVKISDSRLKGVMDEENAVSELLYQRQNFIEKKNAPIYMESNSGYYGLLDILPQAFTSVRSVYLVRDGRDWVRSWMNWGELYQKNFFRSLFAHNWVGASEIEGDSYQEIWNKLSRFERICWAWERMNRFAISKVHAQQTARLYKFEDVFKSGNSQTIEEIIGWCFELVPDQKKYLGQVNFATKIQNPINKIAFKYPKWDGWSKENLKKFDHICGDLMTELGYY